MSKRTASTTREQEGALKQHERPEQMDED